MKVKCSTVRIDRMREHLAHASRPEWKFFVDTCLLVTGASGFIGDHCIRAASHDFERIVAVSRHPRPASDKLEWVTCDLLEGGTTELIDSIKPTHLLHLAWETSPDKYWTSELNQDWLKASLTLIEAFHNRGGRRLVVAGSCAEYSWDHGICREFDTPRPSNTTYAQCKSALFEKLEASSLPYSWARLFFVFGPGEPRSKLIPYIITQLLQSRRAHCKSGNQRRDFVFVKDVAKILVHLLKSDVTGPINVGSGNAYQIREVVSRIADQLRRGDLLEFSSADNLPSNLVQADIDRLITKVGIAPGYELEKALTETITWWSDRLAVESQAVGDEPHANDH